MRLLITGHRGFIGQNLCEAAAKQGWHITTFDIADNPALRPGNLDYTDIDWVIHLGAISSTTETDVRKVMDLNLSWSIELFEECKKNNVNLQFASSASVYGKRLPGSLFKETDECNPLNYYAMSKYLFEEYVRKSEYDITVQGFRYFNVYGPYEEHKGSQASPYTQFAKQAKETGVIKVFEGSENFLRDFIHVDSVITKHFTMINNKISGLFNVGSGHTRSFLDVAKYIANVHNARIEEIPFPEHLRPHYQVYTCANIN